VDEWFRDTFRRSDRSPANFASDLYAFAVAPLAMGGLTVLSSIVDRRGDGKTIVTDLVLVAEASLAAMVVTEVLKPIIVRERPYVHALTDADERREAFTRADALRSFPSGHTTTVFGLASAAGMVATLRGYRLAPLVWATGMMLGLATAHARVASDRHYFTDTMGGAAIGVLFGGGIPLLLHRPQAPSDWGAAASTPGGLLRRASFSTIAVPGGRVVQLGWSF
jgi:membrane-associated phospholipid phosphatase